MVRLLVPSPRSGSEQGWILDDSIGSIGSATCYAGRHTGCYAVIGLSSCHACKRSQLVRHQVAAYRDAARSVFPGIPVETVLVYPGHIERG